MEAKLRQISDTEYVNFEAVAVVRFSVGQDPPRAELLFSTGLTHTFDGAAAVALRSFLQTDDGAVAPKSEGLIPITVGSQELSAAQNFRNKAWFYKTDECGRRVLLAAVNKGSSCSLRAFDAETGIFLRKQYRSGTYQKQFEEFLDDAMELTVASQPNLERDCKERLPHEVLAYLRKQLT